MKVPCTLSQGYTPGLGSGKSHPEKELCNQFHKLALRECARVRFLRD